MAKWIVALFSLNLALSIAHGSGTVKGAEKDLEKVKLEMTIKLESAEKKLSELRIKAKDKGDAATEKTISELEEARAKLHDDVENLKVGTKSNWKKLKSKLSGSIDNLNEKIQQKLNE